MQLPKSPAAIISIALLFFCGTPLVRAQGFINLGFEHARFLITPTPPGQYGGTVDPNLAFNGWTVTNLLGPGHHGVFSLYNDLTIGSSAVVLVGPQFPNYLNLTPLEGSYSVLLQGFGQSSTNFVGLPAIFQSGLIPEGMRSINFLLSQGDPVVMVNGMEIPLISIGGGRVAGDITAFAGQNVQLMFSPRATIGPNFVYFDGVGFSTQVVPEPSTYALMALAVLAVALMRNKRQP